MQKYLVEFIGTFFLVTTIGLVVIEPGAGALAPLAIGAVLTAMVYAGGHVSGAHYNPAVTLAVWIRGKCPTTDVPGYIIAQLAGGLSAAVVVRFMKDTGTNIPAAPEILPGFVAELLFTFALAYVVLNVATAKATAGNSYFGMAIGFTVMAGAFAVGGAFNPAVALGITVLGRANLTTLVVFLVAQCAGAALAALAFKAIHPDDK